MDHDIEHEWPRLIMEYLPLGNLADQRGLSEWETVTFLHQGLDALSYLHSCKIAHRDLKPENILIQCREPANFCIKIADFGLSKVSKDDSFLRTCCGTPLYTAPEIWQNRPYTTKVDIWSLGLIAFQYAYGLPNVPKIRGRFDAERWYQRLARIVNDWDSDGLVDFLSSSMLKEDPLERLSAGECLEKSAKLRQAIIPVQNREIDLGTPTGKMSSSVIMHAFRRAGYGGQQIAADEARTPIGNSTSLPVNSSRRLREYPDAVTQIGDPSPDGDRPNEGGWGQQRVKFSAENGSENEAQSRHSKRPRMEKSANKSPPNLQNPPWKRYEDPVLLDDPLSGCIRLMVEGKAISMRKVDCWFNATQIIALAGKSTGERTRILRILKKHTNVQVPSKPSPRQSWIPYQDGRFLCQSLQLTAILQPLLEYGLKQGIKCDDRANYILETTTRKQAMMKVTAASAAQDNYCQDSAAPNNHADKLRPRCNQCIEKHRKCDRGDKCGYCKAFNLGNLSFLATNSPKYKLMIPGCAYNSKIVAKGRRLHVETIRRAEPVKLLPVLTVPNRTAGKSVSNIKRPHEDNDPVTRTKRTVKAGLQETGNCLDGSASISPNEESDEDTDEETDGETDEETYEETDEEIGFNDLSQHTRDRRTFITTSHAYQSIKDDQNVTDLNEDPATAAAPAGHQCSNFTQRYFRYGSFLPPLKASYLEPERRQHQPDRDSSPDFAGFVDNDGTWLDAVVND